MNGANKLRASDIDLLYWLLAFIHSGKMEKTDDKYWVNFSYAASSLGLSFRQVQDSFNRLCGYYRQKELDPDFIFPLTKTVVTTNKGRKTYFTVNFKSPVLKGYKEPKMQPRKLIETPVIIKGADPNTQKILERLMAVPQRGGTILFTNRLPKNGKITQVLQKAQHKILSIYQGKFPQMYRVSPEFLDRNSLLIKAETWERLKKVKGSWEATEELLFKASRNYRKWFWPNNEPEKKDWLPQDISQWLFDEYNERSVFLACVLREPYPLKDLAADRIYSCIPSAIRKKAEAIYQPEWDPVGYWSKIRDIIDFYNRIKKAEESEPNVRYWLTGLKSWFGDYIDWLDELTGGVIYYKNIGTNCSTWSAWCNFGAKEHRFSPKVFKYK
jgi:hypothetical protein